MHSSRDDISMETKEISKTQNKPFAQVHDDIIILILEKLEWIDRIRVRSVCKKWLQEIAKMPCQGEFPWLFRHKKIDGAGCQVKLTDESSKRSYVLESGEHLVGALILASKFGWVLMMRPRERKKNNNVFDVFVYCPFNCKLINLPTFNRDLAHRHYKISSNPKLPDCVFFAIFAKSDRIEISSCRIGDNEWTNFHIKLSISYERFSAECVKELLYVVMLRAKGPNVYSEPILNSHVGTFDIQSQEWKLIRNEKDFVKSNGKRGPIGEQYLCPVVYNNKDLYLVRQILGSDVWDVFEYDMEEKQWVEQSSLGNRVLFIACSGSTLLVDAVGKLSNMANIGFIGFRESKSSYYPFSFSSRKIECHREFYVDDREFENSKFYERAWILPAIDDFCESLMKKQALKSPGMDRSWL